MWVLDRGNSPDLLQRLRTHSLSDDLEVIWCGEGWRSLVEACHDELAAAFPDYRFYNIKQKWGVLAFQARPRTGDATSEEQAHVQKITEKYGAASGSVCEWCGRAGSLREGLLVADQPSDLTLCDTCSQDMSDTPYPKARPPAR